MVFLTFVAHLICCSQAMDITNVIQEHNIAWKDVCVRWWSMGGMSTTGFRLKDHLHIENITLVQLMEEKHLGLFAILEKGAVYEIMRVQISANFNSSAWVARTMHSQR